MDLHAEMIAFWSMGGAHPSLAWERSAGHAMPMASRACLVFCLFGLLYTHTEQYRKKNKGTCFWVVQLLPSAAAYHRFQE